jgi:hypothetical protein
MKGSIAEIDAQDGLAKRTKKSIETRMIQPGESTSMRHDPEPNVG